jgi:4-hydroxybenzoate polyprenyltransferase
VTSNVLAAIALAGGRPSTWTIVVVCTALSLMYVAGMWLNDAFDRDLDRADNPKRPIPAGEVGAATVFDAGFAMLLAGLALVVATALATGAGAKPILAAVALASLIVFYNANHRRNPLSPVLLGLCRAAVYTTAALLVRDRIGLDVLIGAALMVSYLVGMTYAGNVASALPLAFLGVPFLVAFPGEVQAIAIYIVFASWVVRAVKSIRDGDVATGISGLIAGIPLLDTLLIANLGRTDLVLPAIGAFAATTALQQLVPRD